MSTTRICWSTSQPAIASFKMDWTLEAVFLFIGKAELMASRFTVSSPVCGHGVLERVCDGRSARADSARRRTFNELLASRIRPEL